MILFLITIFVFADFCGYDISCSVKKKITVRFFQGRINDIDVWEQKVADCCKKWLKKTPTVYDSDNNITLIDLFLNIHKRKSIQVWQTGSLLLALKEYANNNKKDIEYLDEIEKNIYKEYFQNSVLHADYGLLAFALLDSGTDLNSMAKYVIDNKTDNGVINYKANIKNVAFVDTLGFICPFLTKYGIVNNDKSFIILAKNQYDWYIKHGIEKHSKLPFHAVDCNSMTTMGICDWARGLAWFLIGIMDSYLCLKRCCGVDDSFYRNLIEKYAEILVKYQNNNGGFNWTLLSGGYITDSSATAVFGWFLACCANILNEDKYLKYAKKCRSFLMSVTNSDGAIDYCQGDTIGIGVYSRNFGIMPFAEAFALRMQEEIKSAK
jgi:unsaturated rhamnogalacturonyl hydrolase